MNELRVLAAGSLRVVWPRLIAAFNQQNECFVDTAFGPAGLLRQRIEQDEPCDLFASANVAHPQALLAAGKAIGVANFTHNQLCLSIRADLAITERDWLELLSDPTLRVATSTPLSDPSGDYTWELFERIEQHHEGTGNLLKQRALQLVGGPDSPAVPAGELAASWAINSHQAEIFIGYQSYAPLIARESGIVTLDIPAPYQVRADYALAVCHSKAQPLAEFLVSPQAQEILQKAGFSH
ncbi:molybdate ABC transporter substrate-binding protein [Pantoea sp. BAV 3049]|uniref:molybdate ABC transporter substrate-binding protein n=1 Tax=Pantoea sp. BAV 3049 TaxID=2654188 RepID=UPI00131D9FE1|nr:molybdate ABC transporter substrate-binding protein [Pantoea sp. BAV 3049]